MPITMSRGTPVPNVPWTSVPINQSQARRLMTTGNPGFLFQGSQQAAQQAPRPGPDITRPTNVLPSIPVQPIPITPGATLTPSGRRRVGKYMYGGPEPVPGFPWRTRETVPPSEPPPASIQPAAPSPPAPVTPVVPPTDNMASVPITDEQRRRLQAGEDPSLVLNQAPAPLAPAPVNNIPISSEQVQRLQGGEDPSGVLGSNILPQVEVMPPLPPAQTPDSVGEPNVKIENQLQDAPWVPMQLSPQMIPDYMSHVITNPDVMNILQDLIPEAPWVSDSIRMGPPAREMRRQPTAPVPVYEPAPRPLVYEPDYNYGGGTPVPGVPWIS